MFEMCGARVAGVVCFARSRSSRAILLGTEVVKNFPTLISYFCHEWTSSMDAKTLIKNDLL